MQPEIIGLAIATRPDCLGDDVLALLAELNQIKPIWIELGLQTIHEETARLIRRGYPLPCFEQAAGKLKALRIPVIVHTILGLPGESKEQIWATINYLNKLGIDGIKLQLLHILKQTDLATLYYHEPFHVYSLAEYVEVLISCVERLSPEIVIHRLTGDGPKDLLIAPLWSSNKRTVLNTIMKEFKARETWQGKLYIS